MATHWRINGRRLFVNIRPLLEHGGAHPRRQRSPATRTTYGESPPDSSTQLGFHEHMTTTNHMGDRHSRNDAPSSLSTAELRFTAALAPPDVIRRRAVILCPNSDFPVYNWDRFEHTGGFSYLITRWRWRWPAAMAATLASLPQVSGNNGTQRGSLALPLWHPFPGPHWTTLGDEEQTRPRWHPPLLSLSIPLLSTARLAEQIQGTSCTNMVAVEFIP
jgi:hypothetical protein